MAAPPRGAELSYKGRRAGGEEELGARWWAAVGQFEPLGGKPGGGKPGRADEAETGRAAGNWGVLMRHKRRGEC